MKNLLAPAALIAASAAFALVASMSPSTPVLLAPADNQAAVTVLEAVRANGISYKDDVETGAFVQIKGKASKRLGRAKIVLTRRDASGWKQQATSFADKKGRFGVKTYAAMSAGYYPYKLVAKSKRGKQAWSFSINVHAPAQPTPTMQPEPTETPTTTPTLTPVPIPTPTTMPFPPTGGLGDPNDWTSISTTHAPRWDPCTPITWSVAGPSPYAEQITDLTTSFAMISEKTGLTFVPVTDPNVSTFDISWSNATQDPKLAGMVLGYGGPTYSVLPEGAKIISGRVVLDNGHTLAGGFTSDYSASWGKVMLHEIMHATGLGHAKGSEQVMYPMIGAGVLGAGDITGLYNVGAAKGCFPAAAARAAAGSKTTIQK